MPFPDAVYAKVAKMGMVEVEGACGFSQIYQSLKGSNQEHDLVMLKRCLADPPVKGFNRIRQLWEATSWDPSPRKMNEPRYFIVSVGPPASGKGTILETVVYPSLCVPIPPEGDYDETFREHQKSKFLMQLDLDSAAMNVRFFQDTREENAAKIKKWFQRYQDKKLKSWTADEKDTFRQYEKEFFESLSAIYMKARREVSASTINMGKILGHVVATLHNPDQTKHIVYETTFCNEGIIENMVQLSALARSWGYTPLIVYPVVFKESLYERGAIRGMKEGRLPPRAFVKECGPTAFANVMAISAAIQRSSGPFEGLLVIDNTADRRSDVRPGIMFSSQRGSALPSTDGALETWKRCIEKDYKQFLESKIQL